VLLLGAERQRHADIVSRTPWTVRPRHCSVAPVACCRLPRCRFLLAACPSRVFANSPWCVSEDNPALCLQGDDQLQPAPFWSPCRSLSCQFNLRPALCLGDDDGTGAPCALNTDATGCLVDAGDCTFTPEQDTYLRPLFDSSFFLGWMWSVPLFGWLADRKGRKVALLCAYTVLMCSTAAAAFATTPTFYLIARHFNGVGIGSQSMSAYVLGTEVTAESLVIAPSSLALPHSVA
jgi:hypothetical protein